MISRGVHFQVMSPDARDMQILAKFKSVTVDRSYSIRLESDLSIRVLLARSFLLIRKSKLSQLNRLTIQLLPKV